MQLVNLGQNRPLQVVDAADPIQEVFRRLVVERFRPLEQFRATRGHPLRDIVVRPPNPLPSELFASVLAVQVEGEGFRAWPVEQRAKLFGTVASLLALYRNARTSWLLGFASLPMR